MNLNEWCRIDEILYTAEANEKYLQLAGFDYEKKNIENLSKMKYLHSEMFVSSFSEPRTLLLSSIESISDAVTKTLELKLHDLRRSKIRIRDIKYGESQVNWNTWRQFNNAETDHKKRRKVFDNFVKKTKYVAPVINLRFRKIRKVYSEFSEKVGLTRGSFSPLGGYLISEGISLSELNKLISGMGERATIPFKRELIYGTELIGKEPEYYDDFYFFRNRIFKNIEKYFTKIDSIVTVIRTLQSIGFDFSKIHFYTDDRPTKYPSPICFFVKIPDDVRVLYKNESPYFNLSSCYHETGHAIHASSIDPNLNYWEKYKLSMGIAEIFSILIERLTKNSLYLKDIGITNDKILSDLLWRNKFMELFFVVFYAANSLMKMEYWNRNLSINDASRLYEKLIKKYMGFEIPGEYWMLHHILPEAVMYVPSYMIAAIRAAELERYLCDRFSDKWWKEPSAGKKLKEIMAKGEKINLKEFSKLDHDIFMNNICSS